MFACPLDDVHPVGDPQSSTGDPQNSTGDSSTWYTAIIVSISIITFTAVIIIIIILLVTVYNKTGEDRIITINAHRLMSL